MEICLTNHHTIHNKNTIEKAHTLKVYFYHYLPWRAVCSCCRSVNVWSITASCKTKISNFSKEPTLSQIILELSKVKSRVTLDTKFNTNAVFNNKIGLQPSSVWPLNSDLNISNPACRYTNWSKQTGRDFISNIQSTVMSVSFQATTHVWNRTGQNTRNYVARTREAETSNAEFQMVSGWQHKVGQNTTDQITSNLSSLIQCDDHTQKNACFKADLCSTDSTAFDNTHSPKGQHT